MDYPDWAPEGLSSFRALIATGQEYGDDKAVELINLIDKLLTDDRMQYVWLALKRRANKLGWDIRFSMRVCELSNGPPRFQSLSKQEVIEKGEKNYRYCA